MRIKSFMALPPNGFYYYEVGGERVESRYWHEMRPLVQALMAKHGVAGTPEDAVSAHMCPDMPSWFCAGAPESRYIPTRDLRDAARPYFRMPLVPYAEMVRRLAACRLCPMHHRGTCLTCTGTYQWLLAGFDGMRARLPDDAASGVCLAAKTYEVAVTSVDGELPIWDNMPAACWRNNR